MEEWRLIEDGPRDGELNMAIDRAILNACELGRVPPTLRLYSWKSPTMSVGYAQKISEEIDFERCRKLGIQLVRRPTGGRALLHNHELTYSFVAPIPHPKFPTTLKGAYKVIASALLEGLRELGVKNAKLATAKESKKQGFSHGSPSCLSSINHLEIEVEGAKLVGSAQRRTKKAFLQHGSILMNCDRLLLNSLFKHNLINSRNKSLKVLNNNVITLLECLGKDLTSEEVSNALKKGFARVLCGNWTHDDLSSYELARCLPNTYSMRLATKFMECQPKL